MSERPKDAADPTADPDATVMLTRDAGRQEPDPDSTVMIPPRGEDPDATVMISRAEPDPDATVAIPGRAKKPKSDPDATVMIPADGLDPDATIAIPTPGRRREAVPVPPAPPLASKPAEPHAGYQSELGPLGGLNPLIAAANPVLAVV